jgi:enoyl-CoA hydratase/carnithine racemase
MTAAHKTAAHKTASQKTASQQTAELPILLHELAGGVATLTLNRPRQLNALSERMLDALLAALATIAEDEKIRVVVLAGSGPAFCAGHDLKELRARREADYYRMLFRKCGRLMQAITALPQPVIARVHGIATAAGCQLVAACDLAVAVDTARFAVSGVNLGLFCSSPSVPLSRNLGRKAAFEMLVTGQFISAEEARAKGLVNRVVGADALDRELESMLAAIVAKPRVAIALGKRLFYRQIEHGIEAAYEDAGRTMACNMMEPEALEGVQAFIDKRKPSWAE